MIAEKDMQTKARALVWFRKDLRLRDNPALESALANGKEIIPVFIWNEEEGRRWRPGAASRWWLHQALKSLADSIKNLGGCLVLDKGRAEELLPLLSSILLLFLRPLGLLTFLQFWHGIAQ